MLSFATREFFQGIKSMVSQLPEALSPEVITRFKRAIETGRWPDGRAVSSQQRETCMEAVLVWEVRHLPTEERTGYIAQKCQSQASQSADLNAAVAAPLTIKTSH